ncbi:hypothetical protein AK812_SmicGene46890 [Symbiodinium microadriaticum]|uniref:Uncharacterized protein n=1 Tax=Symbiodinium microadriaticum TaxID=2951 RepID=A0A1Q9BSY1_SYMMI|nr:hypothetical protein AK812_SmicGene46890 [Symbiodinium microadriaticum]
MDRVDYLQAGMLRDAAGRADRMLWINDERDVPLARVRGMECGGLKAFGGARQQGLPDGLVHRRYRGARTRAFQGAMMDSPSLSLVMLHKQLQTYQ